MRELTPEKIQLLLSRHAAWLRKGRGSGRLRLAFYAEDDLTGIDLSGLDLRRATFYRTDMRGADLTGANLSGAILDRVDLMDADLQNADLSGARLRGVVLDGADLRGARLQGADLTGASARGARVDGADLQRIKGLKAFGMTDRELKQSGAIL